MVSPHKVLQQKSYLAAGRPSSVNETLSQVLENFLDSDLVLTNDAEIVRENRDSTSNSRQLKLFQNVYIKTTKLICQSHSDKLKNENSYLRRFSNILHNRLTLKLFPSEEIFLSSCKELALDSRDILSCKAALLWPHPKNTRNVGEYRWVKTLPTGAIIAVPIHRKQNLPSMEEPPNKALNQSEEKAESKRKQKRKRGLKRKNKKM